MEICSYYRPAEQCSGDWWGYFSIGQDVELVCIADVTGHGAASALVTAMTQATCMTFASRMGKRPEGESVQPSALLEEINQIVYETFKGDFFMTFFCIAFDHRKKTAKAVNAAHNFAMVVPRSIRDNPPPPEPGRLNRFPETLLVLGNPIGFEPDTRYNEKEFAFEGGDRFVLYTDGLIECRDKNKRMYGIGSLRRSIMRHDALSAEGFRDALVGDALRFYGDQPLSDDLTLVTVDVRRR
jgi:serine phosphatase RsbU (regulator of sigma subunit)